MLTWMAKIFLKLSIGKDVKDPELTYAACGM